MADVRALTVTTELVDYAVAHGTWAEDPVLTDLRDETTALGPVAGMQIGPDEGQLLTLFARLVGARRAVEVGTFTGYSSLCIARGLAADGTLLCCDVSEEWTAMARKAWERAGVAERIELRIAPAIETLRSLPPEPTIDLAFIDADKGGYWDYWDELAAPCPSRRRAAGRQRPVVRPGGRRRRRRRHARHPGVQRPRGRATTASTWSSSPRSTGSPSPAAAEDVAA